MRQLLPRVPRSFVLQPAGRASLVLGLVLVILALVAASHVRWQQKSAWERDAAHYQSDGIPMMSTVDAYYALRLARQWAAGQFEPGAPATPRHFTRPPKGQPDAWAAQWEPRSLPLLSRLIASVAAWSGMGIDRTAWMLPPLLSSLFMVPLFWVFWRLGVPAAGVMAGLVGTFCLEYLARTGVGWSDTDQLNLLFPWLLVALFLQMGSDRQVWRLWGWAAVAGVVNLVYSQWYWKPGLALGLAAVLALHLVLAGTPWRRWLPAVALFVLCSGPQQFVYALASLSDFGAHYLWPDRAVLQLPPALRFTTVWATISEVQSLNVGDTLERVLPHAGWAALGGVFFLAWALPRWRALLPLLPWVLLGAMAMFGSRRFVLYLAPFVGAGWGIAIAWLVGLTLRPTEARGRPMEPPRPASAGGAPLAVLRAKLAGREAQAVVASLAAVLVFVVWFRPAADRLQAPPPAIPAPVYQDLKALATQVPADTRLWTWWDLGFAIVDTTGLGVYHDGAVQFTPQTNMVAVSLARPDPALLHALVRFVDHAGNSGIVAQAAHAQDLDGLLDRLRQAAPEQMEVPVLVVFTPDMLPKFSSIESLATPMTVAKGRHRPFGIVQLACNSLSAELLRCDGVTVDLRAALVHRTGLPAGGASAPRPLRRVVLLADGQVSQEHLLNQGPGLTVQLLTDRGQVKAVYLLDETAYASNLNQMYLLGRYDARFFEPIYNRLLGLSAYRVLPVAP